jgi:hypothetical protein
LCKNYYIIELLKKGVNTLSQVIQTKQPTQSKRRNLTMTKKNTPSRGISKYGGRGSCRTKGGGQPTSKSEQKSGISGDDKKK